jgi:Uma2 family endonuclease
MRTVVAGEHAFIDTWIARRRALGQDRLDEVWHGEYHVAAAPNHPHSIVAAELSVELHRLGRPRGLVVSTEFNLGCDQHDFRVPDLGVHRKATRLDWVPTAAMVVEVVSPDDESWLKFDHYASHGVDELLIADPTERSLHLFVLVDGAYEPADASPLLGVTVAELHAAVRWPD